MEDLIPLTPLTLVVGGIRSGKSTFAEALVVGHAIRTGKLPIYLACSEVCDAEINKYITCHQIRRSCFWRTIEVPFNITSVLDHQTDGTPILFDCLTTWVLNILLKNEADLIINITNFLESIITVQGPLVVVTSEVGSGIIPDSIIARIFCNQIGMLNQKVSSVAQRIFLITSSVPVCIKR